MEAREGGKGGKEGCEGGWRERIIDVNEPDERLGRLGCHGGQREGREEGDLQPRALHSGVPMQRRQEATQYDVQHGFPSSPSPPR
eukprot:CAMPEP_0181227582 /NCGR_PEP_ID=MMETSP1096-20121128/32867_1 /TAXON_ID=156174 ORGANISM="Chrysochromulina ericina, Strain CCMP281" /NCGR_SAMPLE_ID=MMETSP1096 /ASSEMBLY_ACC=CAM_ASM_000453 /LENGTH=84 /DNA_ID=CAMNT_0023321001 /DNA_START=901 /DNA_END=1155 /DNA_ORIENTATION=+